MSIQQKSHFISHSLICIVQIQIQTLVQILCRYQQKQYNRVAKNTIFVNFAFILSTFYSDNELCCTNVHDKLISVGNCFSADMKSSTHTEKDINIHFHYTKTNKKRKNKLKKTSLIYQQTREDCYAQF